MKKFNTSQKVVMAMGILGGITGIYGRFNGWEYGDYFPFFYTGMTMVWIVFLPSSKSCCGLFKRKKAQES